MPNFRVLSPGKSGSPITTPGDRVFAQAPGQALDVGQSDGEFLAANGWITVGQSGPTSSRPSASPNVGAYVAQPGTVHIDTSLSAVVVWDGATWRNALTGAAV